MGDTTLEYLLGRFELLDVARHDPGARRDRGIVEYERALELHSMESPCGSKMAIPRSA